MELEPLGVPQKAGNERDIYLEDTVREIKATLGKGMAKKEFVRDVITSHLTIQTDNKQSEKIIYRKCNIIYYIVIQRRGVDPSLYGCM